ncbi:ArsR/SmtB family transcription factor [Curvivirga sp.]|uniref:ArsR/SmtB family transcription factor n=1 Tax=Curvivirga sp. TaxID=2856848 RepID=UPI003B5A9300
MDMEKMAACFAELGHPTRLKIFHYLVKNGFKGVPVGELQSTLDIPSSTLSHHLTKLINVGLVKQRREGKTLFCTPELEELYHVLSFLIDECCRDDDDVTDDLKQKLLKQFKS